MSDEEKKASEEANAKTLEGKTSSELIDIIRETRSEAKERRLKQKELEERLNAIESEKQKAETDKKLAEGKKDEVIQDLTKQLSEAKKKADSWDDYSTKKRTKIKEVLKDNWVESFSVIPLDELETLASKFDAGKELVNSDNGSGMKAKPGRLEGLQKDLKLAIEKKDLSAQIAIKRLIQEETQRK